MWRLNWRLKPERIDDDPSDEGNEEERERSHSDVLIVVQGGERKWEDLDSNDFCVI